MMSGSDAEGTSYSGARSLMPNPTDLTSIRTSSSGTTTL
jgi:hypothetical protein